MATGPGNSGLRSIFLVGGGAGALVGLWTGAWLVGFLHLWEAGRLTPGVDLPEELASHLRLAADDALSAAWRSFNLDLPTQPWLVLAGLVGLGFLIGALVVSSARLLALDPGALAARTLLWALRALVHWPAVLLIVASITLTIALLRVEEVVFAVAAWTALMLVGHVLVPVAVCRASVVATTPAGEWWRPRWPDARALGAFLFLDACALGVGYLNDHLAEIGGAAAIALSVATALLAWPVPLLQGGVLMSTERPATTLRSLLTRRTIGPWAALNLWLLLVQLICVGPFLAVYVWLWKVVPVLASILEHEGLRLPYLMQLTISGMHTAGKFGWLVAMVPLMLFTWLALAKLVASTVQQARPPEAPESSCPGTLDVRRSS